MNDKVLVKQFHSDPGVAFLEVIRTASAPIGATKIKDRLKTAGAAKNDVDVKWTKLQQHLNAHPYVRKPTSRLYEWSIEPVPSAEALRRLSSYLPKAMPGWLAAALSTTIADSLAGAETSGHRAQSSWSEQRELEKAQVLGSLAAELDVRARKGQTTSELREWIRKEAAAKRLEPVAKIGERVAFDPETHDCVTGSVKRGGQVEVISLGYRWLGGDIPATVVRASVRPL